MNKVLIRENGVALVNNNIITLHIDRDGWLTCYSLPLEKQVKNFLLRYAPMVNFNMVKCCYEDDMTLDVNTGEVRKIR